MSNVEMWDYQFLLDEHFFEHFEEIGEICKT